MVFDQPQKQWIAAALSMLFPGIGFIHINRPVLGIICAFIMASLIVWGSIFSFGHFVLFVATIMIVYVFYVCQIIFSGIQAKNYASLDRPFFTHGKLLLIVALACLSRLEAVWLLMEKRVARFVPVEQQDVSMKPTIFSGDQLILDKFYYRHSRVRRGDLVAIESPYDHKSYYNLRVVGIPGDLIEIRGGILYQNGAPEVATYTILARFPDLLAKDDPFHLLNYGPQRLQADQVFCLGDNRPDSLDSRMLGPIRISGIGGRPLFVCWSASWPRFGKPLE